jgi:hypothetical protein
MPEITPRAATIGFAGGLSPKAPPGASPDGASSRRSPFARVIA